MPRFFSQHPDRFADRLGGKMGNDLRRRAQARGYNIKRTDDGRYAILKCNEIIVSGLGFSGAWNWFDN